MGKMNKVAFYLCVKYTNMNIISHNVKYGLVHYMKLLKSGIQIKYLHNAITLIFTLKKGFSHL